MTPHRQNLQFYLVNRGYGLSWRWIHFEIEATINSGNFNLTEELFSPWKCYQFYWQICLICFLKFFRQAQVPFRNLEHASG